MAPADRDLGPETGPENDPATDPGLLGIYLNDHLAGARAGMELAQGLAGSGDETLVRIAEEIVEDRQELIGAMKALGIPVHHVKQVLARVGEQLGKLKPNGRLVRRSPLSDLVELEMLRLGVEGKAGMWRTLRTVSEQGHLNSDHLNRLIERAERQSAELERRRLLASEVVAGTYRRV